VLLGVVPSPQMPVAPVYSIIFCIVWWMARRALTNEPNNNGVITQLNSDWNLTQTEVTNRKCHALPMAFCNPWNLLISLHHQLGLKYPPQLIWPRDPAAILVPWVAFTNCSCLCALQDLFRQACPYQRQARSGWQFTSKQEMAMADANQGW